MALMTDQGEKLHRMFINRMVKKYFNPTILEAVSAHTLRHSFATHLLQNGAPIQGISKLLGHSGLGSTQVYLHLQQDDIKGQHKFSHPKS